jgi:hypothetical protein
LWPRTATKIEACSRAAALTKIAWEPCTATTQGNWLASSFPAMSIVGISQTPLDDDRKVEGKSTQAPSSSAGGTVTGHFTGRLIWDALPLLVARIRKCTRSRSVGFMIRSPYT